MHHNDDDDETPTRRDPEMTNIDSATATAFIAANKGADIVVTLADGAKWTGAAISVNSKGVNIKMTDGKVRSFGLARVTGLDLPVTVPTGTITTKDLAALVGMTPKALRVELRKLGMGVGQGKAYGFDAAAQATVLNALGVR